MTDDKLIEAMLDSWYQDCGDDWRNDPHFAKAKCKRDMALVLAVVRNHDATVVAAQRAEVDRIFDGPAS